MNNQLYKKVAKFIPEVEWAVHEPLIEKINKLKKEKNAVILAHSYMTPEIYHCVADIVGDSLLLAKESQKAKADIKRTKSATKPQRKLSQLSGQSTKQVSLSLFAEIGPAE